MTERVATPLTDVLPRESLAEAGDWGSLGAAAEAVVTAGNADEIVALLRWAAEAGTRVLPLGTGRHREGGPPGGPFVILSTKRLAQVEIYEPADLTVTAGAGLGVGALLDAARPHHQWLPFDPPDFPGRTLGGLVAVGRTGPSWAGYGELKNHVLGATVVCGDGRKLELGGRVVKNVAGFDLLRPIVGSRGTLAVITSVTVRLFPTPAIDRVLVMEGADHSALVSAALAVATAPILPASIVLARTGGSWRLLVRLHGAADTLASDQRTLERSVGSAFRVLDGADAITATDAVRDAGVGLPERRIHGHTGDLGELLERALEGADASAPVVADAYRGTVRVYHALPKAEGPEGPASETGPEVRDLEHAVRRVFDPDEVLWSPS